MSNRSRIVLVAIVSGLVVFGWGRSLTAGGIAGEASSPAGCPVLNIGTLQDAWDFPLQTWYKASRTQSIYLASEIGQGGIITALALNVTILPGQSLDNWTIRMKHTTQSSYPTVGGYLELGGWTVVFQDDVPAGSTGWRTFNFTTPFAYDGVSNLMIDFSFYNTDWSTPGYSYSYKPGNNRSLVRCADDEGDPLTWYGSTSANANVNVPTLQLTVCPETGVPSAPTGLSAADKTATTINWSWTPGSANEQGFEGHDSSQNVMWTAPAGATTALETGLTPNTQYTRHVHAWNYAGTSDASNNASAYTLSPAPNVSCDRQTGCPSYVPNTTFTFTNLAGFGAGAISYYHYVWDRNPDYPFSGSESIWSSGSLQLIGDQPGQWYLHLVSRNVEHESGGTVHLGPFVVSTTGGYPPGDLDQDCDVDADDLAGFIACALGPGVPQNEPACANARLDGDDDVDCVDFAILQRCWSGEGNIPDLTCNH